jgi:AcrR family transcriptional regulator
MPRSPTEPQQTRRVSGPQTDRGVARKQEILEAARRVFEERGFAETRITDIAREAKVSHGTFYTYYETKDAVFRDVADQVLDQMVTTLTLTISEEPLEVRLPQSLSDFVRAYQPYAKMVELMEHVGNTSPEMKGKRLDLRTLLVARTRAGIEREVENGRAAPDLDVDYSAEALSAMIEFVCYVQFTMGEPFDLDRMVAVMERIYRKTIQG